MTSPVTIRARAWMLTINNPTQADFDLMNSHPCQYCIWQKERGKEGTLHIQAFVYYCNPRVWPKKTFTTAHIEPAKDNNACIKYCSKEETRVEGPFERGTRPNQGARTDLKEAIALLDSGGIQALKNEAPEMLVKYPRGFTLLESLKYQDRNPTIPPTIVWIWGLSGVGKTRHCIEAHTSYYIKDGTMWWDGYCQQTAIIIDDFDGKWPYRDFLRLLDRYPYQGQFKGGYIKINSPLIYITCEYPPDEFWQDNELAQVTRRLSLIINLKKDGSKTIRDNQGKVTIVPSTNPVPEVPVLFCEQPTVPVVPTPYTNVPTEPATFAGITPTRYISPQVAHHRRTHPKIHGPTTPK